MASGTQDYQTTSGSLLEKAIAEARKELNKRRNKKGEDGKPDPVDETAIAVLQPQTSLIESVADVFYRPKPTNLVNTDLVGEDPGSQVIDVLYTVVEEIEATNALLGAQTKLLKGSVEIDQKALNEQKRFRRESRLEQIEDLSGTLDPYDTRNLEKKKGNCECNDGLLGGLTSVLQPILTSVLALKALPLALKVGAAVGLKGIVSASLKALGLAGVFQSMKNWFKPKTTNIGNSNIKVNQGLGVDPKDAVIDLDTYNPKGQKTNQWLQNLKKLFKLKVKVNQNQQLQLPESNAQIFQEGDEVVEELVEELVTPDGSTVTQGIDDSVKGGIDDAIKGSGDDIITNSVDDGFKGILNQGDEIAGEIIEIPKTNVKPKFDWKALRNMLNPKNLSKVNWKNVTKGGIVGIITGIITGQIHDAMERWDVNAEAQGIAKTDIERQKKEVQRLVDEILKEEKWKDNPLFRLQQLWGILESVVSMGGSAPMRIGDKKIDYNRKVLEKLKELGIDPKELGIDVPMDGEQYKLFIESLNEENIDRDGTKDWTKEDKNDELSSNNTWGGDNLLGKETLVASTDLSGLGLTNGNSFFQTSTTNQTNNSLSSLTDDDWKWLAYAVSGEAALGTDDVYGVVASILNRYARGDGTIEEIIKADGQYEAYEKGLMYHDPTILQDLKSDEGQAGILEALKILDGRTDFKGQSQLHNRVADEDPMFHEKGNFFHYSWQDSANSIQPEGWKPSNFLDMSNDSSSSLLKPDTNIQQMLTKGVNQSQPLIVQLNNPIKIPENKTENNSSNSETASPSLEDTNVASIKHLTMLSLT